MRRAIRLLAGWILAATGMPALVHAQTCPPGTPANNVCYQGGSVLTAPKIYLVYWGWGSPMSDPLGAVPVLDAFSRGIGGTKSGGVVTQYYQFDPLEYCGSPSDMVAGVWYDNTNPLPSNPWSPYAIDDEALRARTYFGNPAWGAIYVVALPRTANYPSGYCARHGWTTTPQGQAVPYIDFPYQPDIFSNCYSGITTAVDAVSAVYHHELVEALTDPLNSSPNWGWLDTNGSEVSDKCSTPLPKVSLPRFNTSSPTYFMVAPHWSNGTNNETGACATNFMSFHMAFTRGSGGQVYRRSWDHTTDSGSWNLVSGQPGGVTIVSDPAAVLWDERRVDMFAVDSNQNIRHAYSDNSGNWFTWDNWGKPPGTFVSMSRPAVVSKRRSSLNVFVVGCAAAMSCTLFRRKWEYDPATGGITDTGWQNWGSPLTTGLSAPAATAGATGEHRLDVWVRTLEATPQLRHLYTDDDGGTRTWDNWGAPSGATLTGAPDAASWGPSRFDVFIQNTAADIVHRWWQSGSSGWDNWGQPSAGAAFANPGVTTLGDGRLRLFVRGSSQIYRRTWDFGDRGWSTVGGWHPGGLAASSASH